MRMKSNMLFVTMVMVIIITMVTALGTMTTTTRRTTATPKTTTTTPKTTTTTPKTTTTTPKPTTTTPKTTTTTPKTTTTTRKPTTTTPKTTTTSPWTTGHPGVNLNGMMCTVSYSGGGVSFYPPSYSPPSYPHTTPPYYTTTYPSWTTPPSVTGVSVCLRYLTDYLETSNPRIFTLSPSSRTSLSLRVSYSYLTLMINKYPYESLSFQPNIKFLPVVAPDMWTRVCIIVDSIKNVAQVFNGSHMSMRKMLPVKYVWMGEPVIDFSGFDGQVTDVQVWDYPLRYREVADYMDAGVYKQYRGSVLSWSYISYSLRGETLLEEVYELQAKQELSRRGRGRRLKGGKKTRRVFSVGESMDKEPQRL